MCGGGGISGEHVKVEVSYVFNLKRCNNSCHYHLQTCTYEFVDEVDMSRPSHCGASAH